MNLISVITVLSTIIFASMFSCSTSGKRNVNNHDFSRIFLAPSLPVNSESNQDRCSATELLATPCRCCKMDCWYTVAKVRNSNTYAVFVATSALISHWTWSKIKTFFLKNVPHRGGGDNFMRGIDCANSRTLKMLSWPWFREKLCVLEAKMVIFRSFKNPISNFRVRECAQSILPT
jgi:hypothetical protein